MLLYIQKILFLCSANVEKNHIFYLTLKNGFWQEIFEIIDVTVHLTKLCDSLHAIFGEKNKDISVINNQTKVLSVLSFHVWHLKNGL